MRCFALLAMVVLTITCGPSPDAKLPGYATPTGGSKAGATGGTTNTGGTTLGAGGVTGAGGSKVVGTGGKTGPGGATGPGGISGSGGRVVADGGPGGATGTGGRRDAGGIPPGSGGSPFGSGGVTQDDAGRGGNDGGFGRGGSGAGGSAIGGATGTRDADSPSPDVSGACMSQVVSNGYACGSTPACSVCKDQNGNSREAGCKKSVDCLAAAGASCNASCKQDCLNQAGDTPAMACVTALQTAACGAAGCGSTPPPNGGG
jgi:hypothetical protein